jgi:hypothetical protein
MRLALANGPTTTTYLAIGGGGGGGGDVGGGGGAGGLLTSTSYSLATGTYDINLGLGGTGGQDASGTGVNGAQGGSTLVGSIITAYGGGGGGSYNIATSASMNGGSGGGANGGSSTTSPGTGGQGGCIGNGGGNGSTNSSTYYNGGGGGGTNGVGGNATSTVTGAGGGGRTWVNGESSTPSLGGGGSGGGYPSSDTVGSATNGGGAGSVTVSTKGGNGTPNTGGGGGGGGGGSGSASAGGAGGSGFFSISFDSSVVIVDAPAPPPNPISYTPAVFLTGYTYTSGATTWADQSGNARNATVENGTSTSNGVANEVYLNGSTNWQFPNVAVGNAWTCVVWCKISAATGSSCILTQIFTGGGGVPINLTLGRQDGGDMKFGFFVANTGWKAGTTIPSSSFSSMTCLTGTWNGTTLSTYVNGTLLGSTTPGGTAVDAGNAYRIGRRWDNADYVTGYIGEARIYSQVLTSTEVLADYNYVSTVRPYT